MAELSWPQAWLDCCRFLHRERHSEHLARALLRVSPKRDTLRIKGAISDHRNTEDGDCSEQSLGQNLLAQGGRRTPKGEGTQLIEPAPVLTPLEPLSPQGWGGERIWGSWEGLPYAGITATEHMFS